MNQVLEAREEVCDCVREDEEMRQSLFLSVVRKKRW